MGNSKDSNNSVRTRYLFVVRNENDLTVKATFSMSFVSGVLIGLLVLILMFVLSIFLSQTFLKEWLNPADDNSENIAAIVELSETVDSLAADLARKDIYIHNIQRILSGETGENETEVVEPSISEGPRPEVGVFEPSEATTSIIDEMRGAPMDINIQNFSTSTFLSESYFFPPAKGIITAKFNPSNAHFGVDIVAGEDEPVKAIAYGTIILSSWTLETGYVVGIQHSNELISFYKHNSVILKNVGDVVSGGEIISIIGNTGELTTGPHLHFELWYKGSPMNPQEFISFD